MFRSIVAQREQAELGRVPQIKFLRVSLCTSAVNFTFVLGNLEITVIPTTQGYDDYQMRWTV